MSYIFELNLILETMQIVSEPPPVKLLTKVWTYMNLGAEYAVLVIQTTTITNCKNNV